MEKVSLHDSCQYFFKGLAIVYYITVVAFENKIPMCLDDHSLTYCQENPLVKIWKLSRTAYESVVDLGCQQFCKDFIKIFLKGFFWQVKGYLVLFYDIHKKYCTYCQEIPQIPVKLYQTPFVSWNINHSSVYCTFCCIIGNEFLFFTLERHPLEISKLLTGTHFDLWTGLQLT